MERKLHVSRRGAKGLLCDGGADSDGKPGQPCHFAMELTLSQKDPLYGAEQFISHLYTILGVSDARLEQQLVPREMATW